MIHFDSHPDLCRPEHMPAMYVNDKELLFEAINIESWILPTVYGNHVNHVVWIKPPWALQIPEGQHHVSVGEYNHEIFVNSKLDYFITEGAFCPLTELSNTKTLTLDVMEMGCEGDSKTSTQQQSPHWIEKTISGPYILDIDLDFFTTKNPFLDFYKEVNTYERLKEIYIIDKTYTIDDETSILCYTKQKRELINFFEMFFTRLDEKTTVEKLREEINPPDHLKDRFEKALSLVSLMQKEYDFDVDWEIVHAAGCTCDYIELPHHESNRAEISSMMEKFYRFLKQLKSPPTIVTISRSSSDDYCPENVVDEVQDMVLNALQNTFGDVEVNKKYLEE